MRLLVLQLKRIGDAVLTAPALALLRGSLPGAEIHLVLHGPSGQLGPAFPGLASVSVWQGGGVNAALLGNIAQGGWDAVLDFTGTDRSFFMAAISRAKRRFAYERQAAGFWKRRVATDPVEASVRDLPTVDFHLALARAAVSAFGGSTAVASEPPFLSIAAENRPPGLPDRYAVIHPGTARDEKYWTAAGWIEVARALAADYKLPVVLTGSDDAREQVHLAPIRAAMGNSVIDFAGKLDLLETAAVLGGASLVLSVDSAAMHLAAQFGVPQVALFGPTNPFHWAPRHPPARTILAGTGLIAAGQMQPRHQAGAMEEITVEEVMTAAREAVKMTNGRQRPPPAP